MSTTPTADNQSAARFVAANRSILAILLIVIGLAGVGGGVYCFGKAFKTEKIVSPEGKEVAISDPNQIDYISGGLFCAMLAACGIVVGASRLVVAEAEDEPTKLSQARSTLLLAGGAIGGTLMLAGLWFFFLYFNSLTAWLNVGTVQEAPWALVPLLIFMAGAALVFLSAQPARAEERNNPNLRRILYGYNFGLSAVLLLLLLVVGNVFATLKVPNKLDTTESGFYTLSEPTVELIKSLPEPVVAYSILIERGGNDGRLFRDARSLLDECRSVNPSRFRVRNLHPAVNRQEINDLKQKFPQLDTTTYGVLLVAGESEERVGFVPLNDMISEQFEGQRRTEVFEGEKALVRELLFLEDRDNSPTVYFTQSSGEMQIAEQQKVEDIQFTTQTARRLKAALEASKAEVKPLNFDLSNPTVPDDATIVVVANPTTTILPEYAQALRNYMERKLPDGRRGKLLVMLSPRTATGGEAMMNSGLDELLADYGVKVEKQFVYREPINNSDDLESMIAQPLTKASPSASMILAGAPNSLFLVGNSLIMLGDLDSKYLVDVLFHSPKGMRTWTDGQRDSNPGRTWSEMARSAELQKSRRLTINPRILGMAVSEPAEQGAEDAEELRRMVVYGFGDFFADPQGQQQARANVPVELFSSSVNWLRDRPAAANVASKTYGRYNVNVEVNFARMVTLPIALTLLAIAAFGLGTWVFRRS